MRASPRRLAGITLALLFGRGPIGAPLARAGREPSPVVFPEQRLPIRFSHRQHLKAKIGCDFCHESAAGSTSASDHLIPSEDSCATCHAIDRAEPEKVAAPHPDGRPAAPARCDTCHPGPTPTAPPRVEVPPPNLRFNHKIHADREIPCERCHENVRRVDLATRADLPRMPLCLGCHNTESTARKGRAALNGAGQRGPARCTLCHLAEPDGTVRTAYPTGLLVPSGTLRGDAHGPDFATNHAQLVQNQTDQAYCESCHRRDFCLTCHNGVLKPLAFHGNDYLSIHPIDARKASLRCEGCHRRQTFCLGCHERAGVVDRATADVPGSLPNNGRRLHPPYEVWVQGPRTPEHHSWQAERNVRACTSCHREDTCLQCHSTATGAGHPYQVSPHPAGFAQSRQCRTLAEKNGRVCLKCHATDDRHLDCQ